MNTLIKLTYIRMLKGGNDIISPSLVSSMVVNIGKVFRLENKYRVKK